MSQDPRNPQDTQRRRIRPDASEPTSRDRRAQERGQQRREKQNKRPRTRQSMEKIKGSMRFSLGIFITLFAVLIVFLGYSILKYGGEWYASPYNPRIQAGQTNVEMGTVMDTKGIELAWSEDKERSYISDKSTRLALSHVLGDVHGLALGAQTRFGKYLYGTDQSVAEKVTSMLAGNGNRGSDIALTVDARLSDYAYDLLDGNRGSVVLLNYKTGEIHVSVSDPAFDPATVAGAELEDSALVDRATMGRYPPGSTMKIITAAAALEAGIDLSFTCDGAYEIGKEVVRCASDQKHGDLDLAGAFASSCNGYFAALSLELGAERLQRAAEKFGFNTEFGFADTVLYESNFETSDVDIELAWAGVGQYKDLVTPLHLAMIAGAIANDGQMMEPKLLKHVSTSGYLSNPLTPKVYRTVTDRSTAFALQDMMQRVVKSGTGTSAALKKYTVCGKTGTAEFEKDGEVKNHSWFVGYIDDEAHPYAVAVLGEGAGFGSRFAAPLAGKLLGRAVELL